MNDTIDTMPMPLPGPADASAPPFEATLPLRFVGSGSEYFRIWIVNLLLTVLSLGLYYPYARARRLRYFYGATELDGHSLAFLGQPQAMWRGYLLVVLLFLAYAAAGQYSATAGGVALLVLAALWPALWHASLRFRLANTGWRGLRARFTGSRAGAYAALAPLVLMALLLAVPGLLVPEETPGEAKSEAPAWLDWAGLAWLGAALLAAVLLPWAVLRLKRYQHGHYAYGGEQTRLELRLRSVVAVYATLFGVLAGMGVLAAVLVGALWRGTTADATDAAQTTLAAELMLVWVLLLLLLYILVPAYHASRLQNLVWGGTRSAHLRFHSALRFRALAWLTLKNTVLVALTLGLYLPFAAVATARLRLQAVSVTSTLPLEQLVGDGLLQRESAAGDAAGDVMGVDLGL